jgi:hypothetical protein
MRLGIRPTAVALILAFLTACVVSLASATARAAEPELPAGDVDFTLDWNGVLRDAILRSDLGNPAAIRIGAIVHCAMFDAYNAAERRYESIHVTKDAPRGTSPHAAVIQAAYVTLSAFFPAQIATFDGQRSRSLAVLAGNEQNTSIEQGLAWGAKRRIRSTSAILCWRKCGRAMAIDHFTAGQHGRPKHGLYLTLCAVERCTTRVCRTARSRYSPMVVGLRRGQAVGAKRALRTLC